MLLPPPTASNASGVATCRTKALKEFNASWSTDCISSGLCISVELTGDWLLELPELSSSETPSEE